MNGTKRRFFAGNTLQQALALAARHFELDPEEIAYAPIEKRHGFLKGARRVVIEVDPDRPRRPEGERAAVAPAAAESAGTAPRAGLGGRPEGTRERRPGPAAAGGRGAAGERGGRGRARGGGGGGREGRRGGLRGGRDEERGGRRGFGERRGGPRPEAARAAAPGGAEERGRVAVPAADGEAEDLYILPEAPRRTSERYPAATGPMAAAAARGLQHLLAVSGLELSFHILQGEGRLEIELSGDDAELCSSEEGEILRAIEHLLPRLIRTLAGEAVLCRVDCDNFHEIWEERLRTMAQQVAEEVRRRGRPRTLEPMNPADRRIVHMTLADDPAVETESDGEGYFKRITIRPL